MFFSKKKLVTICKSDNGYFRASESLATEFEYLKRFRGNEWAAFQPLPYMLQVSPIIGGLPAFWMLTSEWWWMPVLTGQTPLDFLIQSSLIHYARAKKLEKWVFQIKKSERLAVVT